MLELRWLSKTQNIFDLLATGDFDPHASYIGSNSTAQLN